MEGGFAKKSGASATDLQQKVSAPVNGALELLHTFNPHLVNEHVWLQSLY